MKRLFFVVLCLGLLQSVYAAYDLTATAVQIENMTVDKANYFVTVQAHTTSGEYEVAFDVWPSTQSAIGSFSAADKTIGYVGCYVHKTQANGSAVDMWYYSDEDSPITLSIVAVDDSTCTLSGSITASRNNTAYTYDIAPFTFAYKESGDVVPQQDPYRFEPTEISTIDFTADVVHFREREGYIEVTLNEMANETYNWIELRLLSSEMAMPEGTYSIDTTGLAGTLTASKGYLGLQNDDPCYVAIRDEENWGSYTPYYLVSGSLLVSYNTATDTIFIVGEALSHNGSTIRVNARSYNMLYHPDDVPPAAEKVELAIDSVVITYLSNLSDSTNHQYRYTFNFFNGRQSFPNVLLDAILPQPMALTEGIYSLENHLLEGVQLYQDQADFNAYFFGGEPYVFDTITLALTPTAGQEWTYAMRLTDTIGSEYTFSFAQDPHIIYYPQPDDEVDPEDQPYIDEQQTIATITIVLDSLVWESKTVSRDGVLDIVLTQREADVNGLRAYVHLGMFTSVAYPAAGVYPIDDSEAEGSFSASMGRYGNVLIPCYVTLLDNDGWVHAVWYLVDGQISLAYDESSQPILSGEGTSHFGSTIRFSYGVPSEAIETVDSEPTNGQSRKVLRNGRVLILRNGKTYDILGTEVK